MLDAWQFILLGRSPSGGLLLAQDAAPSDAAPGGDGVVPTPADLVQGAQDTAATASQGVQSFFAGPIFQQILNLVGALVVLLIGWIVALLVANLVAGLLKRTSFDNRVAQWVTGRSDSAPPFPVERWAATFTFWGIMIFAILAFLDALNLEVVSGPLQSFLAEITTYAPRIFGALLLAGVAWVVATIVRLILTRGMARFSLDDRLRDGMGGEGSPILLNETLGDILYWLILLLFLPFILNALDLQGPLSPIQNLVNEVLLALPRIFKAFIIGTIGWFVARFVRTIVTNFLAAAGADNLGSRFGLNQSTGARSLSWLTGTTVYALILIVIGISVLETLQIEAISGPAVATLNEILLAVPLILRGVLILLVAYAVARFVADLVTNVLTGVGFNNVLRWLGLPYAPSTAKTPSEIVGIVALVGIMLFAAIAAVESLKVPELTATITALTAILGQVILGLVIFGVGLYLANLAFRLVAMSGSRQARILAQAARISILVLVGAMALQQMGLATDIVNLAFGLLLGAIAVAIALAFGLGGRDVAAEQLREWIQSFKNSD